MKATIMTLGLALLMTSSAQAQGTQDVLQATPQKGGHHECLLADADTWTSLGLTDEQMTQVKELQASCKKECEAAGAEAKASALARHEEKLKGILTADQYTKWSQWCTKHTAAPRSGMAE